MKEIYTDFKFHSGVSSRNLPALCRFVVVLFLLLFSYVSAQDSLQSKIPVETQIIVIGKAQIYSTDQSFNKQIITSEKIRVVATVNYNADNHTILVTSIGKTKNLSAETKLSQKKIITPVDQSVLAKLKKSEKKAAEKGIIFKNHTSDKFFNSGNVSHISFIVPDSQNHFQNGYLAQSVKVYPVLILTFDSNNFYFNTRSKTFGYSKTHSLRPPPVLVI